MKQSQADIEPVTISEILNLSTWNRPRSSQELRSFIASKHASLPEGITIE